MDLRIGLVCCGLLLSLTAYGCRSNEVETPTASVHSPQRIGPLPRSVGQPPVVLPVSNAMSLPLRVLASSASLSIVDSPVATSMSSITAPGSPSLVWFADDGTATIWKMNGPSWYGEGASVLSIPAPWKLVASGDLNGDGHPDLIWEATTDGTRAVTFMNGGGYAGSYAMLFQFSTDWKIIGTGDFNSDGKTDIALWNSVTNASGVLMMNGTSWTGSFVLLPGQHPDWHPVGVADMNGDSKPDLLLQSLTFLGGTEMWHMVYLLNGTNDFSSVSYSYSRPISWRIGAGGDFDSDGSGDLVLQNILDGSRRILFLRGEYFGAADSVALPTVSTANMVVAAPRIRYTVDPLNLRIAGYYLVQMVQDLSRSVPLVAGRAALARAFVVANDFNTASPTVRFRVTQLDASFTDFVATRAFDPGVPTFLWEQALQTSYNANIPGSLIKPGASLTVTVDPLNQIAETDETDNTASSALSVRTMPRFDVRFVPIRLTTNETGNAPDIPSFMQWPMSVWPLREYDADIHAVFNSSQSTTATNDSWSAMLTEITNLRTVEGGPRYYYGMVPTQPNSYWGGMALLGAGAAVGQDVSSSIAAHEWGHNFNRLHAPGCDAPGPDQSYPVPSGRVDSYGYDATTGTLPSPSSHYDLMGYCGTKWVSGYNVKSVMNYLAPFSAPVSNVASQEPALVVWGRIDSNGTAVLEPSFQVATAPKMPEGDGPFAIEGRDSAGRLLFDFRFSGVRASEVGAAERIFSYALPLTHSILSQLRHLQIVRADTRARMGPLAEQTSPSPLESEATKEVFRVTGRNLEFDWNAKAYRMVMIREAETGEVIGFARGGHIRVQKRQGRNLDLIFSDGVQSQTKRVAVPY